MLSIIRMHARTKTARNRNASNIAAKRGVITQAVLALAMEDGHGSGFGEAYMPWMRIRRRLSSPVSNLMLLPTPVHARPLHLLARTESAAALVAAWLGATEIREQFPLWPEVHLAPFSGIHDGDGAERHMLPGLMSIAEDLGIKHGFYPGTKLPYVATTDLLIRFGDASRQRFAFWACKPAEQLRRGARGAERRWERIRLEEAYAAQCGSVHRVVDGEQFERRLTDNLDWLTPLRSEWLKYEGSAVLEDFSGYCAEQLRTVPVRVAVAVAAEKNGLDRANMLKLAWLLFRIATWRGDFDIDLSQPLLTTKMARTGGARFKQALTEALAPVAGVAP